MIFEHLIDEMPWLYPHGEYSGQLFMGEYGHIDPRETPKEILACMHQALRRPRFLNIYAWEIQAEERDTRQWN